MPSREEKITQIEAALRRRFFTLVPKVIIPGREDWNEERHDIDRLSRALAAYTLVGLCNLDDTAAAGAITDGQNDGGIRVEEHGRRIPRYLDVLVYPAARMPKVSLRRQRKRVG